MRERPCPRCQSLEGRRGNGISDSAFCVACGKLSSNAEWARGKPWTQDEIDQMLKVTR